jgi:hypothetical protein
VGFEPTITWDLEAQGLPKPCILDHAVPLFLQVSEIRSRLRPRLTRILGALIKRLTVSTGLKLALVKFLIG